ncbi:hypothetical protein GPECTOR_1558g720 [Gonium pectorale]|uniref:Uncharacterized protein n=1 Tax=Gonium pectorale TaxID=33097 RepID=A0A150FTD7_GONPE|nr:hypothetical protein GPECTOR_1558g720 [Gonium pectorale]|eukprot:KXZ40881.1 hypothetical protein GPECTOR_1558g720 [Gonium pectorale]
MGAPPAADAPEGPPLGQPPAARPLQAGDGAPGAARGAALVANLRQLGQLGEDGAHLFEEALPESPARYGAQAPLRLPLAGTRLAGAMPRLGALGSGFGGGAGALAARAAAAAAARAPSPPRSNLGLAGALGRADRAAVPVIGRAANPVAAAGEPGGQAAAMGGGPLGVEEPPFQPDADGYWAGDGSSISSGPTPPVAARDAARRQFLAKYGGNWAEFVVLDATPQDYAGKAFYRASAWLGVYASRQAGVTLGGLADAALGSMHEQVLAAFELHSRALQAGTFGEESWEALKQSTLRFLDANWRKRVEMAASYEDPASGAKALATSWAALVSSPFLAEELPELIRKLQPRLVKDAIVGSVVDELYQQQLFAVPPLEALATHWGPLSASLCKALAFLVERCLELMGRVVRKIRDERANCVLVAPVWPRWWAVTLRSMPVKAQRRLPHSGLFERTLPGGQKEAKGLRYAVVAMYILWYDGLSGVWLVEPGAVLRLGDHDGWKGAQRVEIAQAFSQDERQALERLEGDAAPELTAAVCEARLVKASKREHHPHTASCGYCQALPGFCPTHPQSFRQRYELWARPGRWLAEEWGARAGELSYYYYCVACVEGGQVAWAPEVGQAEAAIRNALSEGHELPGLRMNAAGKAFARQTWVLNEEGEEEAE